MPIKYTETHRLYSDADRASAHVVLHLQGVDLPAAQLFVSRMSDVAGGFVRSYVSALPDGVLLPQTSGPCVHYDPEGVASPNGDGEAGEHQGEAPVCAYPSERGLCPHLDNPEILCPVKDSLYAMHEVARMRGVCEAEQDADMAAVAPSQTYETAAPEWVEPEPDEAAPYEVPRSDYVLAPEPAPADPQPLDNNEVGPEPEAQDQDPNAIRVIQIPPRAKRKDAWSEDELWVVARATTLPDAIGAYRAAYPDSARTDGAIKAQWRKLRGPDRETSPVTATPAPDFIGDLAPVTQCEEPPEGITYGDAPEHPPEAEVAAAFDKEDLTRHPWIGMRVRILDPPDLLNKTGVVHRCNSDPREMLVALDDAPDRIWLPPESLLLIGAGRRSP